MAVTRNQKPFLVIMTCEALSPLKSLILKIQMNTAAIGKAAPTQSIKNRPGCRFWYKNTRSSRSCDTLMTALQIAHVGVVNDRYTP